MMNKKLDRLKQWAGERMGGEVKTNTTEEFKALEVEMTLRQDGMESLHRSMTTYMKSLSKRQEGEDREKALSVGHLGSTMVHHGQDFQPDSEYGGCLVSLGRANEVMARKQEGYVAAATSSWLESLERSLVQMKEYQAARKKLEQRRLAYDTSLAKIQKAKREDFRAEEELRSQKAKYEESSDDVLRRMQEIQESEVESVEGLTGLLDAQLAYYDNCREVLLQVKRDWPGPPRQGSISAPRRQQPWPRSETPDRFAMLENPSTDSLRPPHNRIAASSRTHSASRTHSTSPKREPSPMRGNLARTYTDYSSPHQLPRLTRIPTDPATARTQLRPTPRMVTSGHHGGSVFGDGPDDAAYHSQSPTNTYASTASSASEVEVGFVKKAPPPPPPSRVKKAPPPPVPGKRLAGVVPV